MASLYNADYGRYGLSRPGVGPVFVNENEYFDEGTQGLLAGVNAAARGLGLSLDLGTRGLARVRFMMKPESIGYNKSSALYGYDLGSTAYELATGKSGTAGNVISGTLGGVSMWAWNKYLIDQGLSIDSITNTSSVPKLANNISSGIALASLGLSAFESYYAFKGKTREEYRRNMRQANYNDGYSIYNLSRQNMTPNVLSQQDLANYSAIAKTVSQQLTYTQNPAVGYWNKIK